jgi:hypothetical protein
MADNRIQRVHQPAFLQQFSIGFAVIGMIAELVCPRVTVDHQADLYRVFGKNMLLLRRGATQWQPGTVPNSIDTRWSKGSYFATIHKLRQQLLDHEVANQDPDLDVRITYTENVTNSIVIAREDRVASLFQTAANYPGANVVAKAGGSEWNAGAATAVLVDLQGRITKVKQQTLRPAKQLTVIIPDQVFDESIKYNSDILDKIKYTQKGIVTPDLLAELLGVKEVLVPLGASSGLAPESPESDVLTGYTLTQLWGDAVWVGLVASGENKMAPTFARSFNWQKGTSGQSRRVKEYRNGDEGTESAWIEVAEAIGENITFSSAGALITNTSSNF